MKKLFALLILCTCLYAIDSAHAQTVPDPIEGFKLILKHTGNTYLTNRDKAVEDSDTMYVVCAFKIKDRSKLSKLYVKLGRGLNEVEKANLTIDFNNPNAGLPQGMLYSNKGDMVYITLGGYLNMKTYIASIVTEDKDGNKSNAQKTEKK
jgi:hypothetical protein